MTFSAAVQQMTSIMPSKHLGAVFNVRVPTYLLPPQNERQLAAAAAGDDNEQSVPEGFEWAFKKPRGHLPHLSWVCFNEPQTWCVCCMASDASAHMKPINMFYERREGGKFFFYYLFFFCVPFKCAQILLDHLLGVGSDASHHHSGRGVTLTVSTVAPSSCLCGSGEAERASLWGAVHLDRRPISQGGHWSLCQIAWFPCVIIASVLTPSLMCKR